MQLQRILFYRELISIITPYRKYRVTRIHKFTAWYSWCIAFCDKEQSLAHLLSVCHFVLFLFAIVLSSLSRFTDCEYHFDIFKLTLMCCLFSDPCSTKSFSYIMPWIGFADMIMITALHNMLIIRQLELWLLTILPTSTKRTTISHLKLNTKSSRHTTIEIQVLAWDRYKNVAVLIKLMGSQLSP
jgi:hypothetical protein